MRRRQILYRFQALPLEEKLMILGALATVVSCFLPWYGINSRVINEWWNAFSSIGSVAGSFLVASAGILMAMVLTPVFFESLDLSRRFPWSKYQITTFLSAQNAFVSLLFIPVYSQYALATASNSGVRFGLYAALISSLFTSIASLVALQRSPQQAATPVYEPGEERAHRHLTDEEQELWAVQNQESPEEEFSPFVHDEEDQTLVGYQASPEYNQAEQADQQDTFNPLR